MDLIFNLVIIKVDITLILAMTIDMMEGPAIELILIPMKDSNPETVMEAI